MATKSIVVDSSVWVAYFYPLDSQHQKARSLLESQSAPIVVPEYILLETVTILRQKREEEALRQFLEIALNQETYLPAGTLGIEVASCYGNKQYRKLSFVDIALALLSKEYEVISFDKALNQAI